MNQKPLITHETPIHGSQNLVVRPPEQLVGRDSDLTAIHLALKAGAAVLLHGPSGIGKTALAAHLAAGYSELPGGVLWFDVDGDSFEILVNRVVRAYSPALNPGDEVSTSQVRAVLQENRPLVVLDGRLDAEAARECVKTIASTIPVLLASDRMLPGPWTPHAVGPLDKESAEAMIFHVAGASLESYLDQIDRLGRAMEGYPLALYVAGRTLRSTGKTPAELLAQIPSVPPGDANQVLAVILGSYRLLAAPLQGLVLLTGTAFAAGASAELLADVSSAPLDVMTKTLRQLVAHGFAHERTVHGQPYFVVHDLVKRFAQTFLQARGKYDDMVKRHQQGLLTYLRRGTQDGDRSRSAHLAVEVPSLLAAARWALNHDQRGYTEAVVGLIDQMGDAVREGALQPEVRYLKRLLEPEIELPVIRQVSQEAVPQPEVPAPSQPEAPLPDDFIPEQETSEALMPGHPDLYEPQVQELDTTLGPSLVDAELEMLDEEPPAAVVTAAGPPEELPESVERYTEAMTSVRADGNIEDELAAIEALAMLNLEQANYEDVLAYVDKGMKLASEADNPHREGQLLVVLGDLQAMLNNYTGAEMAYKEAVQAFRPTEAWRDIALTLEKLGTLYAEHGRQPDAAVVWDQAIPIFEQVGDQAHLGAVLDRLGTLHAQNFHWDQAIKYFSQALELAKKSDNKQAMFEEMWRLGRVLESSGSRDGALNFYQQALGLAFQLGDEAQLGHTLLALGRVLMEDTIQLNRAVQLLEAALERLPDNVEVQRLLKRARARQERLIAADVTLLLGEESIEAYAKEVSGGRALNGLGEFKGL